MERAKKQRLWADLLKGTRAFLDAQGFTEVTTPCLVPAGAFESAIDPLAVPPYGQLHTSPEMEMKVLLAEHAAPIYQITPCFRDDPASPVHRREFTMLEFYRLGGDCEPLIAQTQELVEKLLGAKVLWERRSVETLFKQLGLDLQKFPSAPALRAEIQRLKIVDTGANDSWNDLFFRVWLEKIESAFDPQRAIVVDGYPAQVSPLTRTKPGSAFSDRFEIYWHGMELCNGCSELSDAEELKRRWEIQNQERRARGVNPHPFPERLHNALVKGIPDCAGVAIGMDRLLLMLARESGHKGNSLL
jgi:lysyl-tRNA synthetase class 2